MDFHMLPCKETFTHITPYRTLRPLQDPVHIIHSPFSDNLDLSFSLSIISYPLYGIHIGRKMKTPNSCCRLLISQWSSTLMWLGLIHNVLWHRLLASPRKCKTSGRLRFVGAFSKAFPHAAMQRNIHTHHPILDSQTLTGPSPHDTLSILR